MENKTKRVDSVVERAATARESNDTFYVTSPYSPAVRAKITPEGMTVYHGDSIYTTVGVSNPNYEGQVRDFARSLSNPAMLSPSRVEGRTTEDIMTASRQEMDVLPISEADRAAIIREHDARFLIETKLSLDNGPGHKYIMDFYNKNVSFDEFFELETRNDESDAAKKIEAAKEVVEKHSKTPEEEAAFRRVVSEKYNEAYTVIADEQLIVEDRTVDDIQTEYDEGFDVSDYDADIHTEEIGDDDDPFELI